jgi:FKBP12-rapamycin complex-associated protein
LQNVSPNLFGARNLQLAVPSVQLLSVPGDVIPNPVRIASFGTQIVVMKSKQAPRQLVMHGTDGTTYRFLVKGGEDLRLDERVMHLFGLINALLREGRKAKGASHMHRQLFIERYNVTPLSPSTGLIGWVNNVSTMHDVVASYREGVGVPNAPGLEFVLRTHIAPDLPGFNHDVIGKLTLMQQTEMFEYVCENTTGMDLQRAFWVWSPSTEQWLDNRTLFSQSAAVTSIAGYLLGLGDRHVENLMISKSTGKVVHIDFGECFEENMKRKSFPERVPFRLTRMMRNAMDKADHRGHFRSAAVHTLSVSRENGVALSLMMEAFLHDPLINWQKTTSNKLTTSGSDIKDALLVSATLLEAAQMHTATTTSGGGPNTFEPQTKSRAGYTAGLFKSSTLLSGGKTPNSGHHFALDDTAVFGGHSDNNFGSAPVDEDGEKIFSEDAIRIVRRVKAKLEGRDFYPSSPDEKHPLNQKLEGMPARIPFTVTQQVDAIIDAAIDPMNLGTMWVGWFPWW